ncbi:unnamed protein product [Rotaria magnacalcarata]|uniref:RRM domain-containing protein n=1 Tax=Rotaria magnacalcarata TaxID=392030 RepID=A0A816ECL4_9BILA|nr:unnamed protein product [Rotaria magnacalcarata]CAF1648058.1 unnamed protein product [Rotaria magnacalcarata]CAF1929773.1 unnamed protein product [Rotaria magnacalcarata]CAF2009631.1 unnamed protein product [Rotaria magnacalcarata]CAF2037575.1 unnamed protein product [Rotaria magnacalcarata]
MPAYIDQSLKQFHLHVSNLPADINAQHITDVFQDFGIITKLYLKRRISKHSSISLPNPFVILVFERRESIDKIMSERPFFISDHQLFVRRCLPITRRYPYEIHLNTNKILVRIPRENHDEILPCDKIIMDYLKAAGGEILRLERFEEQTILVEFDDYDPVDICCLSRPHFIKNQLIEIEKCRDEEQARRRAQFRQKSHFVSLKVSSMLTASDVDIQPCNIISPTPTLNINEQVAKLRLTYDEMNNRLENEHEQLISSLKTEWEQIAKERIRLQRLTLDYKQEYDRLIEDNRHLKKLFSECL